MGSLSTPIVLVEAEKSALAIAAWAKRTGFSILPIAMGGAWGWRGRIGKVADARGERVDEVGALPDLGCAADGRKVYVLLDVNAKTNPRVEQARAALARQLRKQRADVRVLDLPVGDGINGPDDFIGSRGDDALRAVIAGADSGVSVLDRTETFLRRFVSLSDAQAVVITLWILHTHSFEVWDASTPYLAICSAEKQCGKTRLLEILELLVHNPWLTGRATAAALVRKIESEHPTLLLDETDSALRSGDEYAAALTGVLNNGYRKGMAYTMCVGQGANITTKDFHPYGPKAIAGIGQLPDTVADRAIPIRLKRQSTGRRRRNSIAAMPNPKPYHCEKQLRSGHTPSRFHGWRRDLNSSQGCPIAKRTLVSHYWPSRTRREADGRTEHGRHCLKSSVD